MLETAEIFQDNMVLQQGKDLFVWGTAQKGRQVFVEIQGQYAETTADMEGKWRVQLQPLTVSMKEKMCISDSNGEVIELDNIAVGEVWVAGGQSNMEFPLKFEKHYQDEKKNASNSRIRFFDVPKISFEGQRQAFDYEKVAIWREAAPDDIGYFSAVGYYFAKELEKSRGVPVGIVGCNWGGTSISAWMAEDTVKKLNNYWYQKYLKDTAIDMRQYWEQELQNPQNSTGDFVDNPMNEYILSNTITMEQMISYMQEKMGISFEQMATGMARPQPQSFPGCLFQYMVKTIAPYGVRGVL
ncbi:MAG: sialate O-acetylesterase [Lachnospiraceae bacterium]|nr:sialate O-acetylesterase [Lachnospiraceae bacterium]